jgi:malate dehydrogenase (oxaloacetate-decarboxylating)
MDNVSIVCNGTRVIALGNIGTEGAIPVKEGKSCSVQSIRWYKHISIMYTQDKEEIIRFVKQSSQFLRD